MLDKGKGLNRREFIKRSAGTMGLLAILSSPLTLLLNRVKTRWFNQVGVLKKTTADYWCSKLDFYRTKTKISEKAE